MRVLAIDPGMAATAVAVLEEERLLYTHIHRVRAPAADYRQTIQRQYDYVQACVAEYAPTTIAVEGFRMPGVIFRTGKRYRTVPLHNWQLMLIGGLCLGLQPAPALYYAPEWMYALVRQRRRAQKITPQEIAMVVQHRLGEPMTRWSRSATHLPDDLAACGLALVHADAICYGRAKRNGQLQLI